MAKRYTPILTNAKNTPTDEERKSLSYSSLPVSIPEIKPILKELAPKIPSHIGRQRTNIKQITKDTANTSGGAFFLNAGDSVLLGAPSGIDKKTDNKIDYSNHKISAGAGQIAGSLLPFSGASKVVGLGIKGTTLAPRLLRDAVAGAGVMGTQGAIQGESGNQIAKDIALGTVFGVGADLGLSAIGKTISKYIAKGHPINSVIEQTAKGHGVPTETVQSELERLAHESNIRKGKITPQGDTLYGNSFRPTMGELPAPKPVLNPTMKKLSLENAFTGNLQLSKLKPKLPPTMYDLAKGQRELPRTISPNEQVRPEAPLQGSNSPLQPLNTGKGIKTPKEQMFVENTSLPKAENLTMGEKVIGLERGNQGTINKVNADGSYLVYFLNKDTGKHALVKMKREEFEPINQTIMDLKASQLRKYEQPAPTVNHKIDEETKAFISEVAPSIKDISGHFGQRNDIWEILEKGFGKNYPKIKEKILDPFSRAKGDAARFEINKANELKSEVVKKLGIGKGTNESAAVQWFGEKKRIVKGAIDPQTGLKVEGGVEVPYTLEDLKLQFPNKWQNIVEADKWFRKQYDEMIDAINKKRAEIYPNATEHLATIEKRIENVKSGTGRYTNLDSQQRMELVNKLTLDHDKYITGKQIPKRTDYYRHYQEMTEGFAALKNIFDTPSQIGSNLAGISQFTKPKSKWLSLAQHRGKGEYKPDAVGGFLEYVPSASYAINIDPHITKFRDLADNLALATDNSKNANELIRTIREFSDHLAGKTNKWDRILEDMPGGRTGMKALNWVNNRVKANVILGNASASLAQFANIPGGIAYIKDPDSLAKGLLYTIKGMTEKTPIDNSNFITERYKSNAFAGFDESILNKPKELAEWILGNSDAVGARFIWNSAYQKALKNGVKDAMQEADDVTRMLIAGRGIGEVPLNQQRNITKILAPFTLEVQNSWRIQKKFINKKDFGGLIGFYALSYAFNKIQEELKGQGVMFDPFQATYDAVTEKDISPLQRVGRLGGEVLSNMPYGSTLASIYPEFGINIAEGTKTPTRKELFGKNDPTRFGQGLVAEQAITDIPFKLLPSWGGGQLKKSYDFLKSTGDIPNLSPTSGNFLKRQDVSASLKNGKYRFPIAKTPENMIKGTLFGSFATDEGKKYIKKNTTPLGDKQTPNFLQFSKADQPEMFNFISDNRALSTKAEIIKAMATSTLTESQKRALLTQFYGYKL